MTRFQLPDYEEKTKEITCKKAKEIFELVISNPKNVPFDIFLESHLHFSTCQKCRATLKKQK